MQMQKENRESDPTKLRGSTRVREISVFTRPLSSKFVLSSCWSSPRRSPTLPDALAMSIFASWTPLRREKLARVLFTALGHGVIPPRTNLQFWRAAADAVNDAPGEPFVSASMLSEAVRSALVDGIPHEGVHNAIEELLLRERLRSRHIHVQGETPEPSSPPANSTMHCATSTPDAQLKRSQSALQIWKGELITKTLIEDIAMESASRPAASCGVPTDVQLMRSQSPLQIWKGETDKQSPVEDSMMAESVPPPATWSAPPIAADSPLKRSQSALQILKMGRVDSCGGLAEIAPKAPRMVMA